MLLRFKVNIPRIDEALVILDFDGIFAGSAGTFDTYPRTPRKYEKVLIQLRARACPLYYPYEARNAYLLCTECKQRSLQLATTAMA